jgi:hypothetical protein
MSRRSVFLVWHAHDLVEEVDVKLLGVYSSQALAEERVARALAEEGFRDYPDNFEVSEYKVDEDTCNEGFVTLAAGE